jgi:hypothetical protein
MLVCRNFYLNIIHKKANMGGGLMQLVAYGAQDIYLEMAV